ncbi:MAG: TonB-dependent receptor [Acidobacteriaceae bacterium]|nr:TonB-dependent receptor [Acidobacteriaceae bacterium]
MYFLRKSLILSLFVVCFFSLLLPAGAQQTVGGIVGTVTDASGSGVPEVEVTAISLATKLTRTVKSSGNGGYAIPDLPIGAYTLTFKREGFATQRFPSITIQSDRTVTLPAQLQVGEVATAVNVDANPLLNASDTTNGYVLDKSQIESIPQPNGSFTGLATLTPGVTAELPSGAGANDGMGNLPIWANGQRDTSNSFTINGIDASNLFNGKSTSSVGSSRLVNSTGVSTSTGAGGVIQSAASVYLSIGNALPTPAPEFLEEVRVNASMYDAQQGSTSGAHIGMVTASGTNQIHGTIYGKRMTNWLNAAPFFFKTDDDIPDNLKNPGLHRYLVGGTVGGPIVKDKLFGFLGYQHLHVADNYLGSGFLDVPAGLTDDRSASALANIVNQNYSTTLGAGDIDHTALALFNIPAVAGEAGNWLIPNAGVATPTPTHPFNAYLPGTAKFTADIAVGDLSWNVSPKDQMALKYYWQHDPTLAPYAYSSVPGFTEHLDNGAHVISLSNTYLIKPNLSTVATIGYIREKTYMNNEQPFGPSAIPSAIGTVSINQFGSDYFPGVSVYNVLGATGENAGVSTGVLNIGPNAEGQSSNTGVFQNRFNPSADANWMLGKHTVSFGTNYSYTQLNTIDNRTNKGTVATDDLSAMIQGLVTPGGSSTGFYVSSFLQGSASRYYRANQLGLYVSDKYQVTPNLTLTAGLRWDWDGGLTEKEGRIFNFDPTLYGYDSSTDKITNPGFIIAGNNANGTPGVSPTTLTGRQWGFGPRLGAAWQPESFHNKVVVRSGFGMYYDRGELFSYFSPGYAIGTVTGGPFGVNQQLPFVTAQSCPATQYYDGYIPTCGGTAATGNLANPYTNVQSAPPTNPKASDLAGYLPNIYSIENPSASDAIHAGQPVSLGVYDRANKLPYTFNYTLDIQWQPRNDLAIDIGYVGNVGRHQVIPVPFNQPGIATPGSPIHGQKYTYGYTVEGANLPDGSSYLADYEGGNVDHRVPYVGYAAESIDYKAAGVDAYNALQVHVDKRMAKGVQVGFNYTYSHALDEHSGMGLFYNGNNPLNLREAYASSDFDRTHIFNINYRFQVPDYFGKDTWAGRFANGWALVGLTVLQSGQPYSVIDYTGAVGSIYYSTNNGITNPIVPLAPGCTPKNAKTGKSGAFGTEALRPDCFVVQPLEAGSFSGGIPSTDPYETNFTTGQRNIFRQAFQKRADASLLKNTTIKDRYVLKFSLDVFNLTNTASFDIPGNEVAQNSNYNSFPNASYPSGVVPSAQTCSTSAGRQTAESYTGNYFYNCADGVGVTTHTIGSPRQVQFALGLSF